MKEYITSIDEMTRRKKAFISLEISMFLSIIIFSFNIVTLYPVLSILTLGILVVLMIMFRFFTNRILNKQSHIKVRIFDNEIEKVFINSSEKHLLSNIQSVRIKRTSKGLIREIKFNIIGSNPLFINGLEDFEDFNNDLFRKTPNIEIIKFKEPIDLDHLLFYPILGTIIGTVTSIVLNLLTLINEATLKYLRFSLACFIILFGIYFILKKPVKGRYGDKIN
jgi:ABC-type multidrug transport system fused ATPase/permease subunit